MTEDILGLTAKTPSFVKRYAELRTVITDAVKRYDKDVRARRYPGDEHTYALKAKSRPKA